MRRVNRLRNDVYLLRRRSAFFVDRPDQECAGPGPPEQRFARVRGSHQFVVDKPVNRAAVGVGHGVEGNLNATARRRRVDDAPAGRGDERSGSSGCNGNARPTGNQANSISDIDPPGGIIGITASSLGITTSIRTGPGVSNACFIVAARSAGLSILKPVAL